MVFSNMKGRLKMVYDYPDGKIFNKKGELIEKALEYRGPETYYVAYSSCDGIHLHAYEHNGSRRVFYNGRNVLTDAEIKSAIIKDQEKVKEKRRLHLEATGTTELEKSDDKGWVKI